MPVELRKNNHVGKNAVIEERVVKHGDPPEAGRFFNVPYAALEEAVVNAVYHRSYEIREPIEVRVLPYEITVASYPGLDRSININLNPAVGNGHKKI